jgi:hypothetical protein
LLTEKMRQMYDKEMARAGTLKPLAPSAPSDVWDCLMCGETGDYTLVPCQHTLCEKCKSLVNECPRCRAQIVAFKKFGQL